MQRKLVFKPSIYFSVSLCGYLHCGSICFSSGRISASKVLARMSYLGWRNLLQFNRNRCHFLKHLYFPAEEIHAHMGFKLKVSESPLPEEFVRAEGWTSEPQPLPSPRNNICEEAMPGVTGETPSPAQPGRADP